MSQMLSRLWVLMATVFVDMIGFALVLPLLPFYALRFGADAVLVGLLVAAFPFAQLTTAPLWGRLSDRYGRRPMILGGLAVSAVAYTVFGLADSLWLLFLSRLVQGAAGGTTSVVQAYVSDAVEPADRASALGWITSASSAGVMLGPAIGSLASALSPAAPGFVAAGCCLLNFVFAWKRLPESAAPGGAGGRGSRPGFLLRAAGNVLRHPLGPVSSLIWVYAAGMMAFMALNGVLALFLQQRFAVTEKTIGWFYVYVGGVSVLMRTLVLGRTVRRLGELRTMRLGALSLALGMGLTPWVHYLPLLALPMLLVPTGTALLFPSTTSLVSRRVPRSETGQTLGIAQTFGGACRLAGPIWAGAAFQHLGVASPFLLASGLMLLVTLFSTNVTAEAPESSLVAEPPGGP